MTPKRGAGAGRRPSNDLQIIESCNSTWLFDTDRKRFRRVPRGASLDMPAVSGDWERYYKLEVDVEDDSFLVTLNEAGSRLLRSFRHGDPCTQCSPNATTELSLEAIRAQGA